METKEIFIQSLKNAVMEVFSTTLSLIPEIKEKEFVFDGEQKEVVLSCIGLAGGIEGTLNLIFSRDSACNMVSRLLNSEQVELNQDVLDGTGEMANIFAGCFKRHLESAKFNFELSIPSVIHGMDSLHIVKLTKTEQISLYISCHYFDLFLVLVIPSEVQGRIRPE